MKIMPSVLNQVGQNIADNLFEIGQSTVKGTVGAITDIAKDSIEQIASGSSNQNTDKNSDEKAQKDQTTISSTEQRKLAEKRRFEEVRGELARYVQYKKEQERKIAEEKNAESNKSKQENIFQKEKHDSWVSKIINRSQTTTEKGRIVE